MISSPRRPGTSQAGAAKKGSALLAVLWLSAALSVIAFTVANTVRAETERTSTEVDSLRCYYLATAGVDRALLYIQWGGKYFKAPTPVLHFQFPAGDVTVEIIPENSKFNINRAVPADLQSLAAAAGATPDQAGLIARGIVDWRSPAPGGSFTEFDQYYLSLKPSFRARHSSFEEIEELLLVRGMTPDLFYGRYERNNDGRLLPVAGLKDCFSVYGGVGGFDVNTASPTLLRGVGLSAGAASAIVERRQAQPIKDMGEVAAFNDGSPGFGRLGLGVSPIATLRSTAHIRNANGQYSDVQRSVSAMVRFLSADYNPPYHIMRWYDNAWSAQ